MTGLDLAARPAERETKRSMTDEMLSTPKIPDSAGSSLMSPRFLAYSSSSYSSSARSGNGFSSSGHGDYYFLLDLFGFKNHLFLGCGRSTPSRFNVFYHVKLTNKSYVKYNSKQFLSSFESLVLTRLSFILNRRRSHKWI